MYSIFNGIQVTEIECKHFNSFYRILVVSTEYCIIYPIVFSPRCTRRQLVVLFIARNFESHEHLRLILLCALPAAGKNMRIASVMVTCDCIYYRWNVEICTPSYVYLINNCTHIM